MPFLEELHIYDDREAKSAALNMAKRFWKARVLPRFAFTAGNDPHCRLDILASSLKSPVSKRIAI